VEGLIIKTVVTTLDAFLWIIAVESLKKNSIKAVFFASAVAAMNIATMWRF